MTERLWISVNGLIAAGKTTFIKRLHKELERVWDKKGAIVAETVVTDDEFGNEMLELFYRDPKRWAYLFQTICFQSRIQEFVDAWEKSDAQFFISDRDIIADYRVFWETQYKMKTVSRLEYEQYIKLWTMSAQRMLPKPCPDLVVYLKVSVDECQRRKQSRNRTGEEYVTKEYQQLLLERHEETFNDGSNYVKLPDGQRAKCIVIETDENFKDDDEVFLRIVDQIIKQIQ